MSNAIELDARRQQILALLEASSVSYVESQRLIAELQDIDSTLFPNGKDHRDPDIVAYEAKEQRELDAIGEACFFLTTHPHIDPVTRFDIIRRLHSLNRRKQR